MTVEWCRPTSNAKSCLRTAIQRKSNYLVERILCRRISFRGNGSSFALPAKTVPVVLGEFFKWSSTVEIPWHRGWGHRRLAKRSRAVERATRGRWKPLVKNCAHADSRELVRPIQPLIGGQDIGQGSCRTWRKSARFSKSLCVRVVTDHDRVARPAHGTTDHHPPRMEELGRKILGTPMGDAEFLRRLSEQRIGTQE